MHCTEFVQLLSSEANEVSTREKKSTIQPDHVIKALQELGFAEFLEEVTAAWEGHKEESKSKLLSLSAPGGVRHQGRACRRCQQGEGKVTVISLRKVLLPTGMLVVPAVCCAATNSHKAALRKTGADQAGMTEEEQVSQGP